MNEIEITASSCDNDDCLYYQEMKITMKNGNEFIKGRLCHRHCLVCTHLNTYDLYTRLVVGKE
jgi:hypothetical protein